MDQKWIKNEYKITVSFNAELIISNNFSGYNAPLINTVIIVVKQYIYACKCLDNRLNYDEIRSKIMYYQ